MQKAPRNVQELCERCQQISGKTLGDLANKCGLEIPNNLLQAKGWIGQLLEAYLGATASSKALPDFPDLGVELKTIPVNPQGKPLESTYVCTVQSNASTLTWHNSWVYQKLKHVLWVPFLGSREIPIADRVITTPFLWQMDPASEDLLRTDWEELMELLQLGHAKNISAKFGTALHIRPKAANSKVLIDYLDHDGTATKIVPKGFYLRPSFTAGILGKTV